MSILGLFESKMDQFWTTNRNSHFKIDPPKIWKGHQVGIFDQIHDNSDFGTKKLKKTTFLREHIIVRMYLTSIQSPFTILTRTWIIYLFKNMRRAHRHIYHCTLQMTCQLYFTTNDLWYPIIENKTGCLVISISVISAYPPVQKWKFANITDICRHPVSISAPYFQNLGRCWVNFGQERA